MSVRKQRCIDCAFHPKSPENVPYSGPIAAEGGSIIDFLEMRLLETAGATHPFFCHEGLDCIPNDGWRAVKGGVSNENLSVCAGWAAAYRRIVGHEFRP